LNVIVYQQHIHVPDSRDYVADEPVCVVATGMLVADVDVVNVDNVVAAVVMPVPDVVSTAFDFTTNVNQLQCESQLSHISRNI